MIESWCDKRIDPCCPVEESEADDGACIVEEVSICEIECVNLSKCQKLL